MFTDYWFLRAPRSWFLWWSKSNMLDWAMTFRFNDGKLDDWFLVIWYFKNWKTERTLQITMTFWNWYDYNLVLCISTIGIGLPFAHVNLLDYRKNFLYRPTRKCRLFFFRPQKSLVQFEKSIVITEGYCKNK